MSLSNSPLQTRLKSAIAEKLKATSSYKAKTGYQELSDAYRRGEASRVSNSVEDGLFLSYIAARMPATFAVVSRVLDEYEQVGGKSPRSVLDIGAGPATASIACLDLLENVTEITLLEKETRFRDLALDLAQRAQIRPILDATWYIGDVSQITDLPRTDLAIASYSLGELPLQKAKEIATKALSSAALAFIVIEPGTPKGFALVRDIREHLLALGAYVAAPCPHQKACPMSGSDFCHFSERLEREHFHRDAKNASLPYEDEKFSYAIFTKDECTPYFGRLVKKPIKSSGHVTLDICHDGQIVRKVVARSNKALYRPARKAEWGDRFNVS